MVPIFPTEKSFLAFLTKKIPIILAETDRINDLRREGFDMFDDLINHGYDRVLDANLWPFEDNELRIKFAIDSNFDLLNRPVPLSADLIKRLDHNWNFAVHDWVWAKLQELIDHIQIELDRA
jgi:hypothetical protein